MTNLSTHPPLSPHPPAPGSTHTGAFSWKTSQKYSSHATAIHLQVSSAALAKLRGIDGECCPCLELPEAQG